MSNHPHRRPHPEEPQHLSFFRRLFKLGPAPEPKVSLGSAVAAYTSSRVDAELMAGYLRSNGIKAIVSADDEGGLSPALQGGRRVRVLVPPQHHDEARLLLDSRE